jgi:hypothetical protein
MQKGLFLTIFVGIIIFALSAYGLEISVGPSYSDLDLSGKVKYEVTEIDVEEDLGIGDDEPLGIALELKAGKHNFFVSYADVEFKGEKTINKTITFGDTTYAINTFVESQLKYTLYEVEYWYNLLKLGEELKFSLSPLFKVSVYDAEVTLKAGATEETYSEMLPVPTVGIVGDIEIGKYIGLFAKGSGIGYAGNVYLEYESFIRLKPISYLNLDIGYQGRGIDFEDDDNLIDIDIEGFFLRGLFRYEF